MKITIASIACTAFRVETKQVEWDHANADDLKRTWPLGAKEKKALQTSLSWGKPCSFVENRIIDQIHPGLGCKFGRSSWAVRKGEETIKTLPKFKYFKKSREKKSREKPRLLNLVTSKCECRRGTENRARFIFGHNRRCNRWRDQYSIELNWRISCRWPGLQRIVELEKLEAKLTRIHSNWS